MRRLEKQPSTTRWSAGAALGTAGGREKDAANANDLATALPDTALASAQRLREVRGCERASTDESDQPCALSTPVHNQARRTGPATTPRVRATDSDRATETVLVSGSVGGREGDRSRVRGMWKGIAETDSQTENVSSE